MSVSGAAFSRTALELLTDLSTAAAADVERAADLVAGCVARNGVIQVFGTGHSQAAAMEIAGRAGGLIPTNRIALSDLVIYGGRPPTVLADPLLERSPGLAAELLGLLDIAADDVFVIVSNSGINASVVDMAVEVTTRGHPLIAITSLQHTRAAESRHPSGKRLADLADVVIDNMAPHGESLLPMRSGAKVCAVSSITTAFLVQMLVAETVRRLEVLGVDAPVYLSANVEGGHERNVEIEAGYGQRLRRWAV